ncbi:DEAD/DEAH box helicase [Wohlfahrtiimonas chitiniclastica]|uniref:DEAD/DEAH box helicase n=1 Tax=Wohlfahrtiimonas chitiniclastica TaxID=400946 RepID=UPI001BD0B2FE|nr:DEAD/DEAH box helicase family protein [Wohlfahrtiimonas chitiniclastica]MBS7837226.1 DEAD/DEAH box helicase family protein [Wohlfahrtiimonas chitiniclastica]
MTIQSYFLDTPINVEGNKKLRNPQIFAYGAIKQYFESNPQGEALVVLPTGTGKSGLISIAPFGVSKGRVLIITPGRVTKESIKKTQDPLYDNFWLNYDVIFDANNIPSISEFTSTISDDHLKNSNIVYSNVQKLTGNWDTRLLNRVSPDFFDLIIIDEAHHAPADSWQKVLDYFAKAKKLHVTGTPYRGDGQKVPGELIHETSLSEVMRERYVKWLRKQTVNAEIIQFILEENGQEVFLGLDDVKELRDDEWIEKSIALSKECSLDVIQASIDNLNNLKESSPQVPHKILAVGCSIKHAEDVARWYQELELKTVLIHSSLEEDKKAQAFIDIDNHNCDVVVSVNMLMEGYDHHYLSTLALFRPYRSLNAFAQVVGRVLRRISDDEITDFAIDNNALVIFHEEIGLNKLWQHFQKETDKARRPRVIVNIPEVGISDREYAQKESLYGQVSTNGIYQSGEDSYIQDLDFNELFNQKRQEIKEAVSEELKAFENGRTAEELAEIEKLLGQQATKRAAPSVDSLLIEKRPDQARQILRTQLKQLNVDVTTNILFELSLDDKGAEVICFFNKKQIFIPYAKEDEPNDAVIAKYINQKLYNKFGKREELSNEELLASSQEMTKIQEELIRLLSGIKHEN